MFVTSFAPFRRYLAAALTTLILTLTAALATPGTAAAEEVTDPAATATPGQAGVAFGAFPAPTGGDLLEAVNVLEKKANRRLDVVNTFKKWGGASGSFAAALPELASITAAGRTPMITWEPLPASGYAAALDYPVTAIASGSYDSYLASWANGIRDFGGPVYLRPMHEMNGNWYSAWSGDPAAFIAAWRRIHSVFAAAGAHNAKFVWSVNADDVPYSNYFERYWPGSAYVDVLGIDGYNCYVGWRSFSQIFRRAYSRITMLDPVLPVWITETGSCEADPSVTDSEGHSKAEWIGEVYTSVFPRVRVVSWLDTSNSRFDWRVSTSGAAVEALRASLAASAGWVAPPAPYVPAKPSGLVVVPDGTGAVQVSWQPIDGYATGYRVLRRLAGQSGWSGTSTVAATTRTLRLTGLTPGQSYRFGIQSYTRLTSSGTAEVALTLPLIHLVAPQVKTAATQTRVTLSWGPVDQATEYRVYRGDGTLVAVTTGTSYVDGPLATSTAWSYFVVAARVDASGVEPEVTSDPSATVAGVTTSATPTGVTGSLVNGMPLVSWKPVTGAIGYRVLRGTILIATVYASEGVTQWLDTTAEPGVTYSYAVASFNSNSQSARSVTVTLTAG